MTALCQSLRQAGIRFQRRTVQGVLDWADRAATHRSYSLLAHEVFPRFQGTATSLTASRDWAAENRPTFIGAAGGAVMDAIQKHAAEKAEKAEKASAE